MWRAAGGLILLLVAAWLGPAIWHWIAAGREARRNLKEREKGGKR